MVRDRINDERKRDRDRKRGGLTSNVVNREIQKEKESRGDTGRRLDKEKGRIGT